MGLACGHELARLLQYGEPVPILAMHAHWRYDAEKKDWNNLEKPAILDPLPQRRTCYSGATEAAR
jgi:hypothetical protein